jgi:hypothetical protein
MRSGSAKLVKLGVLTVAVLLAAAALWTYGGQSDSPSSGSDSPSSGHLGRPNNGWGDLGMPGPALKSHDGHGAKGAENGGTHRHTPRSRPVISGPVPPRVRPAISGPVPPLVRPVISGPVPPGLPGTRPLIPTGGGKTTPVSRERRPARPRPRTIPPRLAPKPRAPRGGSPSNPTPAPKPPPQQAPDQGTPPSSGPGTTPADPGTTPTDPGAAPTNPGTTPTAPPVPAADPDAGLDDTPAGGLDQTDLGGPVDEAPPGGGTPASTP